MIVRRLAAIAAMLLLLPALAGCWDNHEPRRRAYVLSMGIDPSEEDPDRFTVTMQFPKPTGGGRNQQASGGTLQDHFLVQGEGRTLLEAMQMAQDRLSRELYLGQLRSLILSSDLSEEQVRHLSHEIRRNPDIEEAINMLMARGRAARLMGVPTPQERVPALYFSTVFESVRRRTVSLPIQVWQYWRELLTAGREAVLPIAEPVGENEIRFSGLAVFHGYEIRGVLEPEEVQGYLWLMGQTNNRTFSVQTDHGLLAVRSLRAGRSVSVRFERGRPVFAVTIRVSGEVLVESRGLEVTEEVFLTIEEHAADRIRAQVEAVLEKAQRQYRSDIFGFGTLLYYRYPAYFDSVRWDQVFPDVRIEPSIQVRLARKGTIH